MRGAEPPRAARSAYRSARRKHTQHALALSGSHGDLPMVRRPAEQANQRMAGSILIGCNR